MSDQFGNHIVGFPTRRLIFMISGDSDLPGYFLPNEPPRGKTNNVVSEQG